MNSFRKGRKESELTPAMLTVRATVVDEEGPVTQVMVVGVARSMRHCVSPRSTLACSPSAFSPVPVGTQKLKLLHNRTHRML